MRFVNPLLLLSRLDPSPTQVKIKGHPETDIGLMRFSETGDVIGGRSCSSAAIPNVVTGPLRTYTKCYTEWPGHVSQASELIVRLKPFKVGALRKLSSDAVTEWRQRVTKSLFGEEAAYNARQYLSLVYVELQNANTIEPGDEASAVNILRELRDEMGESASVCVPQFYKDLLVSHGLLGDHLLWDVLAIRAKPLVLPRGSKSVLALPVSLFEVRWMIRLIHRLRSARAELERQAILRDSAVEQVGRLLSTRQPELNRVRSREWRRVVTAYERHLRERLGGIEERQNARALGDDYLATLDDLQTNARRKKDDFLWLSDSLSHSPYRWGTVSYLTRTLDDEGSQLSALSAEMEMRDAAIREYLRDYLSAANASGNMAVQRAVVRLTVVAVVIALVSLAVSIVASPSGVQWLDRLRVRFETVFNPKPGS